MTAASDQRIADGGAPAPRPPIDPRFLRRCLGQFATGVTVVSYELDAGPRGTTVNSFTSVSMDPPLILVSIANTTRAATGLAGVPFVVNVLASVQHQLAVHFSGRPVDGLDVPWTQGRGVPRLRGTAAWFQCEPWAEVPAGDHVLFIGRVVAHDHRRVAPLLFQAGQFRVVGDVVDGLAPEEHTDEIRWLHHSVMAQGLADDGTLS
jgi:flavin reductase (DIM6/NTAB) family NADH-FMN oxidoreductase RutF